MFLLGGAEVYQEHVRLSSKFNSRYFLMSTTYHRHFRLIERFRAEIQNFQNDLLLNFNLKFLFSQSIDFSECFLKRSPFFMVYGKLKKYPWYSAFVGWKNKKNDFFGYLQVLLLVFYKEGRGSPNVRICLIELKILLKVFPNEYYLSWKFQIDRTFSCRDSKFSKWLIFFKLWF